jgi:hypothetical protein
MLLLVINSMLKSWVGVQLRCDALMRRRKHDRRILYVHLELYKLYRKDVAVVIQGDV